MEQVSVGRHARASTHVSAFLKLRLVSGPTRKNWRLFFNHAYPSMICEGSSVGVGMSRVVRACARGTGAICGRHAEAGEWNGAIERCVAGLSASVCRRGGSVALRGAMYWALQCADICGGGMN